MNIVSSARVLIFSIILVIITETAFTAFEPQKVILVYPLIFTGDSQYAWTAAGLSDAITADLCKVPRFMIVSRDDRIKVIEEMELAMTGLIDEKKNSYSRKDGSRRLSGNRIMQHFRQITTCISKNCQG